MKRNNCFLIPIMFLTLETVAFSQFNYNAKQLIPFDPAYKIGYLNNGIRYIIRSGLTEKKAHFYAFYNIGSIQEEPNEYGLAHLIEHLCFYEKPLLDHLESSGLRMGRDINAGTGPERTTYTIFNIPSEKAGLIDTSLLHLKDLALKLNIKPEYLNKERKVVLEEWRQNQGANARINDKITKEILKGTRYARPSLLGDTAVINNCTVEDISNFFNKWYRPDHLTILVFGNFDQNEMEDKIAKVFGSVPKVNGASPRISYQIPDYKAPVISIAADKEAKTSEISIHYKHNKPIEYNYAQKRTEFIDNLIYRMFQKRINEIIDVSDAPITKGSAYYGSTYFGTPSYDDYALDVSTNGNLMKALETILTEKERIVRHGFTDSELQRAKEYYQKMYDKARHKNVEWPHNEYMVQCFYYILKNKTIASFDFESDFLLNVFPTITLVDINKRFKKYFENIFPAIEISYPQKVANAINISDVENVISSVNRSTIAAYIDKPVPSDLFSKSIKSGKVIKETSNNEVGTTEWELSNGMRVIIKATEFAKDEIQFKGYNNNDTLKVPKDYLSTSIYGGLSWKDMGVGEFSPGELKQYLVSKNISVTPFLSIVNQGIKGKASSRDLEAALQLVYLYFSKPSWNEDILKKNLSKYGSYRSGQSPSVAFSDTVQKYMTIQPFDTIVTSLNLVTMEKLKLIYQKVFSDPGEFTFIFTGNIKIDETKPLIEKYLGSLQRVVTKSPFPDSISPKDENKLWYKTGVKTCRFEYPMQTPKAFVFVCCQGEMHESPVNSLYDDLIQSLIVAQAEKTIRGKYGASYNVSAYNFRISGKNTSQISVYFQTNPGLCENILPVAKEEIKKFMDGDIDEKEFLSLKNNILKRRTDDLKSNSWWTNTGLFEYYFHHNPISKSYVTCFEDVTMSGLKEFARNLYSQGNTIEVIMMPK